ncbi:MAG: (d)CMP kinase [Clostridia bacterium]|nr:(d)CMP kinase [Clostridia bacterium]
MISIALDGPAGAGKSTIAKALAKKLGFIYVDTGALYRATALKFIEKGIDTNLDCDIDSILKTVKIDIRFIGGAQHVFLNDADVNDKIRTSNVSMMASAVSAKPPVRAFLLDMQRQLAKDNNVLMDGRDIGTVVLPDATLKFFVTASAEERARRRVIDLEAIGEKADYNSVLEDIKTRDYNDSHREIAPLKPAADSIVFDTTGNTLEQSVEKLYEIINERLK